MKFRKKPVIIDAVRLGWDTWNEVCDFVSSEQFGGGCYIDDKGQKLPDDRTSPKMGLTIKTLEGEMLATEGDWIIRGVKGEFYPCKPDVFESTYEEVQEQ